MKKKIAVFTGTRAEYGLLRPVLEKMHKSDLIQPLLCVTGAHLSEKLGFTISEIEADNMPIAAKIDILKFEQGPLQTAKATALAIDKYSEWLFEAEPCAVLLLGDRYEAFAAASAAAMLNIPIIHISGGDVTLGASDEFFRHSITKMSSLHFPSCIDSATRVIQLGESPKSVYCVGGLGDENLRNMRLLDKDELAKRLNISLEKPYFLITYHPETASNSDIKQQMNAFLNALSAFEQTKIFTKANADAGGEIINEMLDKYCAENINAHAFASLGTLNYLSAMKYACAVAGNSSSGVVETPTLGVPCVNIGTRQKGRIITQNVICCNDNEADIKAALKRACTEEFIAEARRTVSPYYGENTSAEIVRRCEEFTHSESLGKIKQFYDIKPKDVCE